MPLILTIDRARWESHQGRVLADVPGLVPVAKGNGYGFGLGLLAEQATNLKVAALAVGIAQEVEAVRGAAASPLFDGDVVVLNPWRPFDSVATSLLVDPGNVVTVSRPEDLAALGREHPGTRVQVEIMTAMRRHGLDPAQLDPALLDAVQFEGWTIHLPSDGSLRDALELARRGLAVRRAPLWVSHLSIDDYRSLAAEVPVTTHMRIGTRLWLGDKSAYRTTATVLDVHPIRKGERLGYHQGGAPRDGHIVIVSGGTAHGVAMAAPVPQRTLRQRGVTVAQGILEATGHSLSPYEIGGRKRAFAEPPHMHSSMIFVPGSDPLVSVGDEVPVTTRMTTVTPDEVRWV